MSITPKPVRQLAASWSRDLARMWGLENTFPIPTTSRRRLEGTLAPEELSAFQSLVPAGMASKERRRPLAWIDAHSEYSPSAPLDHPNTVMAHEIGHALHLYQPGIRGSGRPVEKKVHEFIATMSALEYLKRHRPQDFKSFMSRIPTSFEHRLAKKVMAALPRAEARNKLMRSFFKAGVYTEHRLIGWLSQHNVSPYEFKLSEYREPDYF